MSSDHRFPDSPPNCSLGSFVLANTEVLHEKINQLANRVRHLEDALAESHSRYSEQPHHLLSDELLQIKRPLERERMNEVAQKEEKVEQSDSIDAMGSLCASPFATSVRADISSRSISQDGRSTFFGTTANSWVGFSYFPAVSLS